MYNLISGVDETDLILGAYDLVGATQQLAMQNPQLAQLRAAAARGALQGYGGGQQFQAYGAPNAAALQQAMAFKQAQAGALLKTMNPTKARKQVLGMVSNGTIAASGTATITARPQTFAFKPERVVIPATVGPDFTLQDIKVGNISQLVQSGDLPAEAFSQTAFGVEMDMDTVQTSQDFIINVTNISGGARTFRAMILGRSANG